MPLFDDNAHSVAMIKHGMECISKAVHKLNSAQTPVIAFDQTLYAMAKIITWNQLQIVVEGHFVVMVVLGDYTSKWLPGKVLETGLLAVAGLIC